MESLLNFVKIIKASFCIMSVSLQYYIMKVYIEAKTQVYTPVENPSKVLIPLMSLFCQEWDIFFFLCFGRTETNCLNMPPVKPQSPVQARPLTERTHLCSLWLIKEKQNLQPRLALVNAYNHSCSGCFPLTGHMGCPLSPQWLLER